MANIVVLVAGQAFGVVSGFRLAGQGLASPDSPVIQWETADISWDAAPWAINQAVADAAAVASDAAGYTIGPTDNIIILGGAR